MNVFISPSEEEKRIREKYYNEVSNKKQESEHRVEQINNASFSDTADTFFVVLMGFLGVIIGPIVCVCSCNQMGGFDDINWILGVVSAALCFLIATIIGKFSDNEAAKFEQQRKSKLSEEETRIQEVEKELEDKCDSEIRAYKELFEEESQKLSLKYVESEVTKEIASWVSKKFFGYIDSASRESHIKEVEMLVEVDVYNNKVVSSFGEYDFEKNRCDNLNSFLEQSALGRAIASIVQLEVMMNYPKNKYDNNVDVKIDYTYLDDHARVNIMYHADNCNYKEIRSW